MKFVSKILNKILTMDLKKLRPVSENAENVFEILPPYYMLDSDGALEAGKKKAIFFGTAFKGVASFSAEEFAKRSNACLDYIRRECGECDLYYRPHPAESNETDLLNLKGFTIVKNPDIGERYLWEDRKNIKYAFSPDGKLFKSS